MIGRQEDLGKKVFRIVQLSVSLLLILACISCRNKETAQQQVVIYTSLDKVFSRPILDAFEKEAGIKVLAVYDSEATKTTGLVNRLIAEKDSPRADVFWNSETGRTIVLKRKGVLPNVKRPSHIPTLDKIRRGCEELPVSKVVFLPGPGSAGKYAIRDSRG